MPVKQEGKLLIGFATDVVENVTTVHTVYDRMMEEHKKELQQAVEEKNKLPINNFNYEWGC